MSEEEILKSGTLSKFTTLVGADAAAVCPWWSRNSITMSRGGFLEAVRKTQMYLEASSMIRR